jgi:hypothetical protein
MANKVKTIWDQGEAVLNGWLEIPSGFSAGMMAQCGFDSVTVDLQHGVQEDLPMVHCLQAMQPHRRGRCGKMHRTWLPSRHADLRRQPDGGARRRSRKASNGVA